MLTIIVVILYLPILSLNKIIPMAELFKDMLLNVFYEKCTFEKKSR